MHGTAIIFKTPDILEKNAHGIERGRELFVSAIKNAVGVYFEKFGSHPTCVICTPQNFARIQNEVLASGQMRNQWLSGEGANLIYVGGVYVWGAINYTNENESVVI